MVEFIDSKVVDWPQQQHDAAPALARKTHGAAGDGDGGNDDDDGDGDGDGGGSDSLVSSRGSSAPGAIALLVDATTAPPESPALRQQVVFQEKRGFLMIRHSKLKKIAPEAASLSSARSGCAPTPLVFPLCLEQPACLHPCKADGTIPLPCVLRLLCGVSTHASVTRVARAHARVYDLSDAPTRGATTSPTGSAPRVRPTSEVFNPAMLASTSLDHRSKHIKYASAATFPYHTAHVRGGG
eukprot:COSAG01_NODE_2777_length_7092_cov_1.978121_6_plen_240_part_00